MEFEYDEQQDRGEVVAYIKGDFLIINDNDGVTIALSYKGIGTSPRWNPEDAFHKFYKGDTVTITF